MSQGHSEQPRSRVELTNEELTIQARAAADQALQLAKLAEESARLARHLNEQVAVRAGHSIPPAPHFPRPASDADRLGLIVNPHESLSDSADAPLRQFDTGKLPNGPHHVEDDSAPEDRGDPVDLPQVRVRPTPLGVSVEPVRRTARNWKSVFLSTALHLALLALLGLLTVAIKSEPPIDTILASFAVEDPPVAEEIPIEEPVEDDGEQLEEPPAPEPIQLPAEDPARPAAPEPMTQEPRVIAEAPAAPNAVPAAEPAVDLAQIGSRSEAGKALLLKKYGGTAASEAAVSRALEWFASVQRRDGSWNFNDVGPASHAGSVNNPMGATSYVVLAFLGAGQTHQQGVHKANVSRAINFLIKHARSVGAGADFRGPNVEENHNFYVQGAAAMALCEAFTMTKDRRLRIPAQRAIDFIVAAQDPHGGGWRYEPREAGCTSVTTLQLTALISADRGGFRVPPKTLDGIRHFYETVQCDDGPTGRYCYRAAEPSYTSASTAQATLGRMYLGTTRNDVDLQAAITLLDKRGPYDNRYYCYYATQALKNWGGEPWQRWNASMRDELVRTQVVDEGPAIGSWTPLQRGTTDVAGGRLFTTALSTMTLEVYYRYLPLYDSLNGDGSAPVDATEVAAEGSVNPPPPKP